MRDPLASDPWFWAVLETQTAWVREYWKAEMSYAAMRCCP